MQFSSSSSAKTCEYSEKHEQALLHIYETIKDKIDAKLKLSLDELLTYYCYIITQKIRSGENTKSIENNLAEIFSRLPQVISLDEVKSIQFYAKIDDKQARQILIQNPNKCEFV